MREIQADAALVARCGLYCSACGSYLKERCEGCLKNEKAAWCKIRTCIAEQGIATCAECADFESPKDCKKFNIFMSKMFSLVFRSDRPACIARIKEIGISQYAEEMAKLKLQAIKR